MKVIVKLTGEQGSGRTSISEKYIAPATGAMVEAFKKDGWKEIGEHNGFTILFRTPEPGCQFRDILQGVPRTEIAIRASGAHDGDLRVILADASQTPIHEAMAQMKKRVDDALIVQLDKDANKYELTGYEREYPMYRGFGLYLYNDEDGKRIVIRARTAVARLYSAEPDDGGGAQDLTTTFCYQTGLAADTVGKAKELIDRAYEKEFTSLANVLDLPLEIPTSEPVYDHVEIKRLLLEWRNATFPHPDPLATLVGDPYRGLEIKQELLRDHGVKVYQCRGDWQYAFPVGGEQSETALHWKVHTEPGMVDENGTSILDENGNEIGYEIEIPITEVMPREKAEAAGLLVVGAEPAAKFGGPSDLVSVQVGTRKRWVGQPKEPPAT